MTTLQLDGGAAAMAPVRPAAETLVSKGEYARHRGVSASAVSHWIRDGRIHGPALRGQGRYAKIALEVADRQLADNLDLGQQMGNGAASAPVAPVAPAQPIAAPVASEPAPVYENNSHQARYQAARAQAAEIDAERSRRRLAEERGLYMQAAAARAAIARQLGEAIRAVELWLPELADKIAAETGGDRRALSLLLSREFRVLRSRQAAQAEAQANAVPELVGDDEGEDLADAV